MSSRRNLTPYEAGDEALRGADSYVRTNAHRVKKTAKVKLAEQIFSIF